MCSSQDIWQLHLVLQPSVWPASSKWIYLLSPMHLRRWKPPAVLAHPRTYPTWGGGTGPACCFGDQMWCPFKCPNRQNLFFVPPQDSYMSYMECFIDGQHLWEKTQKQQAGFSNLSFTHLLIMLTVFDILVPWLPLKVKSPILQVFECFQHSSS